MEPTSLVASAVASLAAAIAQHRTAIALAPAQAAAARALAHDLLALAPERPTTAPPTGAAQAAAAEPLTLLSLPPELLVAVLQWLSPHELARVERVARAFHGPPPPPSLVEQALRQRAAERGALVPAALPAGEASWVQYLSWRERLASRPQTQWTGAGERHTAFIDEAGKLLTCGLEDLDDDDYVGYGPDVRLLEVPTPVPVLVGTRVVSVSSGDHHTLVLTEAGAVLSFGVGYRGRLGHGDEQGQHTPRMIEVLRCERVMAVSAGEGHSLVLTAAGAVLDSWGVRRVWRAEPLRCARRGRLAALARLHPRQRRAPHAGPGGAPRWSYRSDDLHVRRRREACVCHAERHDDDLRLRPER